jgi:hypothetical protein
MHVYVILIFVHICQEILKPEQAFKSLIHADDDDDDDYDDVHICLTVEILQYKEGMNDLLLWFVLKTISIECYRPTS